MAKTIQKVIIVILLFVVSAQAALAAATIADIYSAPSEAEKYYGGSGSCEDLDVNCNDSDYSSISDGYTFLGDGSTSTYLTIENKSSSQSGYLKIVYHVDGLFPGTYKLRVGHKQGQGAYLGTICAYQTLIAVNASSCRDIIHFDGDQWSEYDITDIVLDTVVRFNSAVVIRFFQTSGTANDVAEIYLKRPFKLSDLSIEGQGVSETEVGMRVENTWNIVSGGSVPPLTNATCTLEKLREINESENHELMNISLLNVEYEIDDENTYFKVYWDANESAGIVEGYNYELECSGYIGELYIEKFSQFVYVNRQRTIFEYLNNFVMWVLQLIGITQDTQQLVSGQVEMVDSRVAVGGEGYATTFLNYADTPIDVNATCWIDIWYPNSTQWVDGWQMIATGSAGRYIYNVSVPIVDGLYQMRSFCNGTALMNRTRFAYANLEVFDDVKMMMVT